MRPWDTVRPGAGSSTASSVSRAVPKGRIFAGSQHFVAPDITSTSFSQWSCVAASMSAEVPSEGLETACKTNSLALPGSIESPAGRPSCSGSSIASGPTSQNFRQPMLGLVAPCCTRGVHPAVNRFRLSTGSWQRCWVSSRTFRCVLSLKDIAVTVASKAPLDHACAIPCAGPLAALARSPWRRSPSRRRWPRTCLPRLRRSRRAWRRRPPCCRPLPRCRRSAAAGRRPRPAAARASRCSSASATCRPTPSASTCSASG